MSEAKKGLLTGLDPEGFLDPLPMLKPMTLEEAQTWVNASRLVMTAYADARQEARIYWVPMAAFRPMNAHTETLEEEYHQIQPSLPDDE